MRNHPGSRVTPADALLIDDPGDSRLDPYRDLSDRVAARRLERHPEFFVVEGSRTIRRVAAQGWGLVSVLLSERRAANEADLLELTDQPLVAPAAVVDAIAGFRVHRGALAIARRPPPRSPEEVIDGTDLVLAIEGVNDHENIGALFRNAAAFGVGAVLLDPSAADPLYRRSVRVSLGNAVSVPFARVEPWPARLRGGEHLVLALSPGASVGLTEALRRVARRPVILLVGAEGDGLSSAALEASDLQAGIPMAVGVDSLNVATAAAVALYAIRSAAAPPP